MGALASATERAASRGEDVAHILRDGHLKASSTKTKGNIDDAEAEATTKDSGEEERQITSKGDNHVDSRC